MLPPPLLLRRLMQGSYPAIAHHHVALTTLPRRLFQPNLMDSLALLSCFSLRAQDSNASTFSQSPCLLVPHTISFHTLDGSRASQCPSLPFHTEPGAFARQTCYRTEAWKIKGDQRKRERLMTPANIQGPRSSNSVLAPAPMSVNAAPTRDTIKGGHGN